MNGIIRTRVGYAGGKKESPTYRDMGDHTECIQIDYDSSIVAYEELIRTFWISHDPTYRPWKRQYISIVFFHDEQQKKIILDSKEEMTRSLGKVIHTEVQSADVFYLAEFYHQKYYLQQVRELMTEFRRIYPDQWDFVHSTLAARINGYIAYGKSQDLGQEIDAFGLSPEGRKRLLEIVAWRQ